MKEIFWKHMARLLAHPVVTRRLIERAKRSPYLHICSADGSEVYMERYWLLNPYDLVSQACKFPWLPISVRLHFIRKPDSDRHCHDHPWNARTVILGGGYTEKRMLTGASRQQVLNRCLTLAEKIAVDQSKIEAFEYRDLRSGDTVAIRHGEYHQITDVHLEGALTLFITGRYRGVWGFMVDGVKVPWRKYLGLAEHQDLRDLPNVEHGISETKG